MNYVKTEEEVYHNISVVKRNADQYLTNFYFTGSKLKDLIYNNNLYMVDNINNIFFLRKNDGFFNLHFCSSNKNFLDKSLAKELTNIKLPIVTDLVGEEKTLIKLKDVFIKNNFRYYTTFIRMSRINDRKDDTLHMTHMTNDFIFAKLEDSSEIYNIITSNFNKYSEHLTSLEEIKEAINKYTILIKKRDKIAALSFHDKIGISSIHRYLFVDQNFRGQKLGMKILKKYFDECKTIKRFILWVESSNIKAINIYKDLGYDYDNLIYIIMNYSHKQNILNLIKCQMKLKI